MDINLLYRLFKDALPHINNLKLQDVESDPKLYTIARDMIVWRENERVKGGYAMVKPHTRWIYAGYRLKILRVDSINSCGDNGFSYRLCLIGTKFEYDREYRNTETLIPGMDLIIELPNDYEK